MKKFVNDPRQFVPEMLKGIALANPETLKYVPEYNLIMRTDAPRDDKVSIIQGSGSGHEPAHVMIVGKGMLDAACPGDVFAAPPMDYVLETSKLLASPKGVLHIINNYTGDRMAFEMGQEMAEADGITIGTLIVMINGLGGTPVSELYLLYGYAHEQLAQRGINVRRNYVGNYCTSLDMAGTSITLSRLDQEIAELLVAPAEIAIRTF